MRADCVSIEYRLPHPNEATEEPVAPLPTARLGDPLPEASPEAPEGSAGRSLGSNQQRSLWRGG